MKYFCPQNRAGRKSFVSVYTSKMNQLQLKNLIVLRAAPFSEYISPAYGRKRGWKAQVLIDVMTIRGALVFILVCRCSRSGPLVCLLPPLVSVPCQTVASQQSQWLLPCMSHASCFIGSSSVSQSFAFFGFFLWSVPFQRVVTI